jgi:PAS domain S-box-containing protein
MNLPTTATEELVQIEILKQINENLCADSECSQLRQSMLEYSSNTYKMLFNTHPDSIALIRLSDGHLLEANQSFEKLLGYTKDEFRKIGIGHFLKDEIKKIQKMAREALRKGGFFQTECHLQSRDNGLIPVALTASVIKHDEETLVQASMRKL